MRGAVQAAGLRAVRGGVPCGMPQDGGVRLQTAQSQKAGGSRRCPAGATSAFVP